MLRAGNQEVPSKSPGHVTPSLLCTLCLGGLFFQLVVCVLCRQFCLPAHSAATAGLNVSAAESTGSGREPRRSFESVHRRANKMLLRLKDHNTGGQGCQELSPGGPREFKVMQAVVLASTFSWWNWRIANDTNSCQVPASELNSSCSAVSAPFVHRIRFILGFFGVFFKHQGSKVNKPNAAL